MIINFKTCEITYEQAGLNAPLILKTKKKKFFKFRGLLVLRQRAKRVLSHLSTLVYNNMIGFSSWLKCG